MNSAEWNEEMLLLRRCFLHQLSSEVVQDHGDGIASWQHFAGPGRVNVKCASHLLMMCSVSGDQVPKADLDAATVRSRRDGFPKALDLQGG